MIHLEQPSVALNDFRVPSRYHMWRTWDARTAHTSRKRIINEIRNLALSVPNGDNVKNLVINGHGTPGRLAVGEGFSEQHLQMFYSWSGLFNTIWLMGCFVGRHSNMSAQHNGRTYSGDGHGFCSELAVITRADVIASTELQVARAFTHPYGYISALDGLVLVFQGRTGRIIGSGRSTSAWQDSQGRWHGAGETMDVFGP